MSSSFLVSPLQPVMVRNPLQYSDSGHSAPEKQDLYFSRYPEAINPILKDLCTSHELLSIMESLKAKIGAISIIFDESISYYGEWNWKERSIKLNPNLIGLSKSDAAAVLIFELCNASKTDEIVKLHATSDSVAKFVMNCERIEHDSALAAKNIFYRIYDAQSECLYNHIYDDFFLHYAFQQLSGHSEWIGAKGFPGQEYHGTLLHPLNTLNVKARKVVLDLFYYHLQALKQPQFTEQFCEQIEELKIASEHDSDFRKAYECAAQIFCY